MISKVKENKSNESTDEYNFQIQIARNYIGNPLIIDKTIEITFWSAGGEELARHTQNCVPQ